MEITEGIDYVRSNSRAVLATVRRDGAPQMSPVTLAVLENTIVMSTRETAYKVVNLRRDPRAWLCVFPDSWYGRWFQLGCTTKVESLPDVMDSLIQYYRTLRGDHPDWIDYRQAMSVERRCLVRFNVLTAGPDLSG